LLLHGTTVCPRRLYEIVDYKHILPFNLTDDFYSPTIIISFDSPRIGQELEVTCQGNVGRSLGQALHSLRLQIMLSVSYITAAFGSGNADVDDVDDDDDDGDDDGDGDDDSVTV